MSGGSDSGRRPPDEQSHDVPGQFPREMPANLFSPQRPMWVRLRHPFRDLKPIIFLEVAAILIAVFALIVTIDQAVLSREALELTRQQSRLSEEATNATRIQLEDMKADQTARYWQILTTPAVGNSGKRDAIEWLFRERGDLR